ncbi:MAG TPA: hypothetical protein VFC30_04450 [Solirubrobacteraceae bacterium]|nr:hypothetical protein [Solirubrobacteraceae bacterium]
MSRTANQPAPDHPASGPIATLRRGPLSEPRERPQPLAVGARAGAGTRPARPSTLSVAMSPTWIWTQIAIIVFVVIGMIVAITKLA